jgi:hypothetical protein
MAEVTDEYILDMLSKTKSYTLMLILSGDASAQIRIEEPARTGVADPWQCPAGQSLLAAELVEELRLVIAPVVVGRGRRLFPDGGAPAGLRLLRNETTPGGLAAHVYQSAGPPKYGTYAA